MVDPHLLNSRLQALEIIKVLLGNLDFRVRSIKPHLFIMWVLVTHYKSSTLHKYISLIVVVNVLVIDDVIGLLIQFLPEDPGVESLGSAS